MRHGLNFGAGQIPMVSGVRERRRKGIPCAKGTVALLVGACDTAEEQHSMTIQATNGKRGLYWETIKGRRYVWAYCPQ